MTTLYEIWISGESDNNLGKKIKEYEVALGEFTKRKLQNILTLEYEACKLGEKYENIREHEYHLREVLRVNTAKKHGNLYCFITINPDVKKVNLETFRKKMDKLVNRNIFKGVKFVYEQRGQNHEDRGKGFHCHIIARRNLDYKPNKVSSLIKNSCKGLCNVENDALLNIKWLHMDYVDDKIDYIEGTKIDEGKDVKQEQDVIWRKETNIDKVYNLGTLKI